MKRSLLSSLLARVFMTTVASVEVAQMVHSPSSSMMGKIINIFASSSYMKRQCIWAKKSNLYSALFCFVKALSYCEVRSAEEANSFRCIDSMTKDNHGWTLSKINQFSLRFAFKFGNQKVECAFKPLKAYSSVWPWLLMLAPLLGFLPMRAVMKLT